MANVIIESLFEMIGQIFEMHNAVAANSLGTHLSMTAVNLAVALLDKLTEVHCYPTIQLFCEILIYTV